MSEDEFVTECFWKTEEDGKSTNGPKIKGVGLFNKRARDVPADIKLSPLLKKVKIDAVGAEKQHMICSNNVEPNRHYYSDVIDLTSENSSPEKLGKGFISISNANIDPVKIKTFTSPIKVINNPAQLSPLVISAQTDIMIGGINVKFPCKPYKSQISVINSVS